MGNSSKSKPLTTSNIASENETMMDDFEPIDKPASPTWMSSFVSLSASTIPAIPATATASPANDLATSGILVEAPTTTTTTTSSKASTSTLGRRVVKASPPPPRGTEPTTTRPTATTTTGDKEDHDHALPKTAQSDEELLQESLDKDKERRLLQLQSVQKSKRQTHVMAQRLRRRDGDGGASAKATANPFSRFLSVFSVEPSFPSHKRPYEPSPSELLDDDDDEKEDKKNQTTADRKHYVLEAKRAKIDPSAAANDDDDAKKSVLSTILRSQWEAIRRHMPDDWLWMVGVAATSLLTIGLLTTFAQHPSTTSLSSSRRSW